MSVTSNRSIIVSFSQDIEYSQQFDASPNPASQGNIVSAALNAGDNIIVIPYLSVGVTIVMPVNNLIQLKLKGSNTDVGIPLHLTDPTSLAIPTSVSQIILNASGAVVVKLLYN